MWMFLKSFVSLKKWEAGEGQGREKPGQKITTTTQPNEAQKERAADHFPDVKPKPEQDLLVPNRQFSFFFCKALSDVRNFSKTLFYALTVTF